jgi:lipopolysaccharide export system protein LptC
MADVIDSLGGLPSPDRQQSYRADAFRAAGRHSARVRQLKRVMIIGSVAAVIAVVGIGIFDPFRHVPKVSFDDITLTGSKVSLQKPLVTGFRQDGRPYQIKAASMTQDLHTPTAFDLTTVEGVIGLADKGSVTITANSGIYDNTANYMVLNGDVHLKNDSGYEAFFQTAHIDFKKNDVVSDKPVKVLMNTTTVTADTLKVVDSGKSIIFDGHVKSLMIPPAQAAKTAESLKGTTQ